MTYHRVQDVLNKIAIREEIHGLVEPKHSPEAKYKSEFKGQIARPSLKVGRKVLWPIRGGRFGYGDISGYALGVILDWHDNGRKVEGEMDSWSTSAELVVQVVKVSNRDHEWLVGHLRSVQVYRWSKHTEMPIFVPEEGDPKDYGIGG